MKKTTLKRWHFLSLGLTFFLAAIFVGCPNGNEGTSAGKPDDDKNKPMVLPSTVKMTVPYDESDPMDNPDRKPQRIIHTVWYEPEEDPRQVIGYQLKDGTPYFDHLTLLYGMRLVYKDCATAGGIKCSLSGLHICYDMSSNVWYYLENWEEYLKPIRERGIKVLLSIVPAGTGAGVGNLFSSSSWTAADKAKYGDYPFNEEATYKLIDQIAEIFNRCQIDGIGYDEEYIGQWIPPTGASRTFATSGTNIVRFSYELEQAVGRKLINEFYEWGSGVPATTTFKNRKGEQVTAIRDAQIDYTFNQSYGGWSNSSTMGIPKNRSGPCSVAVADTREAPKPTYDDSGNTGIRPRMRKHLYGGFGVVMYYCLRSREELKDGIPKWQIKPFPSEMYGAGNAGKPEAYFSQISRILHGQDTEYSVNVQDYPRAFQMQ